MAFLHQLLAWWQEGFLQFCCRVMCANPALQQTDNAAGAAAGLWGWCWCLTALAGLTAPAGTQLRSCLLQPDNNPGQVCCLWLQGSALGAHFERELQELLTS